MITNIISRLRDWYQRVPLSPAESAVAMFVVCALAFSVGVRLWNSISRPAMPPIPNEFSTLDSEFVARSHAPIVPVSTYPEGTLYSAGAPSRKSLPTPNGVNINSAGPEQLRQLPMVGPALASRIITFRTSTPFRKPEDLQRVEGIGPKKWERIRPYIRTE